MRHDLLPRGKAIVWLWIKEAQPGISEQYRAYSPPNQTRLEEAFESGAANTTITVNTSDPKAADKTLYVDFTVPANKRGRHEQEAFGLVAIQHNGKTKEYTEEMEFKNENGEIETYMLPKIRTDRKLLRLNIYDRSVLKFDDLLAVLETERYGEETPFVLEQRFSKHKYAHFVEGEERVVGMSCLWWTKMDKRLQEMTGISGRKSREDEAQNVPGGRMVPHKEQEDKKTDDGRQEGAEEEHKSAEPAPAGACPFAALEGLPGIKVVGANLGIVSPVPETWCSIGNPEISVAGYYTKHEVHSADDVPEFIRCKWPKHYGGNAHAKRRLDQKALDKYNILTGGRPYYVQKTSLDEYGEPVLKVAGRRPAHYGPDLVIFYLEPLSEWVICKARDTDDLKPLYYHDLAKRELEAVAGSDKGYWREARSEGISRRIESVKLPK